MDYHGITSVGKIYVQRVSTLPTWSLTDIARVLYANDTYKFYFGGSEAFREIVDTLTVQTITGIKTFSAIPLITSDPTEDDHAVRLGYLQDKYIEGWPDLTPYVTLATDQEISGIKNFSALPISSVAPTNVNHFTNKAYVDLIGPKVKITSTDSTAGHLFEKVMGGEGITLTRYGMNNTNQKLMIQIAAGMAGITIYSDLPVGTIIKFAGQYAPENYLECDGSEISRTEYFELYGVIFTEYGEGNGTTTFNVPLCTSDSCSGEMWCIKYREITEGDKFVRISETDTDSGYLEQKLVAGDGITLTKLNPNSNESLEISVGVGNPNNGFWLKYANAAGVWVKAGTVSINNTLYSMSTDQYVSFSGNLNDGEWKVNGGTYGLYAVAGTGSTPTFKYSWNVPTVDKYGQTQQLSAVAGNTELYHPIRGNTWRYLGQTKLDASGNFVTFDKAYPGYWESWWNVRPWSVIPTAFEAYSIHVAGQGWVTEPAKFGAPYNFVYGGYLTNAAAKYYATLGAPGWSEGWRNIKAMWCLDWQSYYPAMADLQDVCYIAWKDSAHIDDYGEAGQNIYPDRWVSMSKMILSHSWESGRIVTQGEADVWASWNGWNMNYVFTTYQNANYYGVGYYKIYLTN